MSTVKLNPNYSYMHIDTSCLTLDLPDINIIIEQEQKPQRAPITIFKSKTKSNSNELF